MRRYVCNELDKMGSQRHEKNHRKSSRGVRNRERVLLQDLERAAPPHIGEPMPMLDGADVEGGDPTSTHEELPVARDAPPVAPNTPRAPPGAPRTMIDAP